MSKSMFKRVVKTYHSNSWATFSKKYPNTRVEDIFAKDPDYLLYCFEKLGVAFSDDVKQKLSAYKTNKEKRNIKKVTCFK